MERYASEEDEEVDIVAQASRGERRNGELRSCVETEQLRGDTSLGPSDKKEQDGALRAMR